MDVSGSSMRPSPSACSAVGSELRNIFRPYRRGTGTVASRFVPTRSQTHQTQWSHRFCCLPGINDVSVQISRKKTV